MDSTDSQKYLASHYRFDNGKQVNRKYTTDKKLESKENGSQFPEEKLPMHSGIKEMYSSVNVLNGQQVVIENKKVCNHCHRKLNPDFFFFANKFGYGLKKSQNGDAKTGEAKIIEQNKTQSIQMADKVAAKMLENYQEKSLSSQQLKKTNDSDVLVGSGKMKCHSDIYEYSNIKHQSEQMKDFAVGFKKHETLTENSSQDENDGYYQSRETMFKYALK